MPEQKSDDTLPILVHILGLLTGFLGPLIVLLVPSEENAKKHAKVVLNWQFSLLIYFIISLILMIILIGFLGFVALVTINTIFSIIGAVRASEGQIWRYPLSINFFKVD